MSEIINNSIPTPPLSTVVDSYVSDDYNRARTSSDTQRVSYTQRPVYDYYCKSCEKRVVSRGLPKGWYLLRRNDLENADNLRTVAMVCSFSCLLEGISKEAVRIIRRGY